MCHSLCEIHISTSRWRYRRYTPDTNGRLTSTFNIYVFLLNSKPYIYAPRPPPKKKKSLQKNLFFVFVFFYSIIQ